jgi:hypothetical protein
MFYAKISIYQDPKHPWKQSDMPKQADFRFVKKVQ